VQDGFKHFSVLFNKALADARKRNDEEDYALLARFIGETCEEFFRVFMKTASEKRKIDTTTFLYDRGVALLGGMHDRSHASILFIVHSLEEIAKFSDDDDDIMAALSCIRRLTDIFLDAHKTHEWEHISGVFDEICLAVTRISEDYYLQKDNSLKTMPIVGYTTGVHRTVTAALVEFFCAYRDLGDRYTDGMPLAYFEAIEGLLEVLFDRLGEITENGRQNVGVTSNYHKLTRSLYQIYEQFGMDAIEHKQSESLGLAMSNLRRIIKPAKEYKLALEHQEIAVIIMTLSAHGLATFGDVAVKADGRTVIEYALETLKKHTTAEQRKQASWKVSEEDWDNKKHGGAVQSFVRKLEKLK
jgi:hypothetical protein